MKVWSEFYDYVKPHVPGADNALVDLHLREAAIEFYERSQAWRWTHPQIVTTALTANYPFVPLGSGETEVHVINYAEFNGEPINVDTSEFQNRYSDWRNLEAQPEFAIADQTDVILVPIPIADGTIDNMIVSLKPTPASTGIFDDLQYNDYRTSIVHGVLYRLMMLPKKPFTNYQVAADHLVDFNSGINAANIRVEMKYTNANLETGLHTIRRHETKRRIRRDF